MESSKFVELNALPYSTKMRLAKGLSPLLDTIAYAVLLGKAASEAALSISELCPGALTSVDCDMLAAWGIIEIRGQASPTDRKKVMRRSTSSKSHKDAIVVLTPAGTEWVREWASWHENNNGPHDLQGRQAGRPPILYDVRARELYLGGVLVLVVGSRASNKEHLLCKFEDNKWEKRIANSLESHTNGARAQQLRDAVHGLNALQDKMHGRVYLRFHADEKGHTAWYEITADGKKMVLHGVPGKAARILRKK